MCKCLPFLQAAPIVLPLSLAAFAAVAMLLLVTNAFYSVLIFGLGLPAAFAAGWMAWRCVLDVRRPGNQHAQRTVDSMVFAGVLLWVLCNIPFASQHVLTNRDPATYAVAGAWLVQHHDLHIPKPALSGLPGMDAGSLGFSASIRNPHEVYAQGAHLLPALLGAAGKLVGDGAMLHMNVMFGGLTLLAFYGFARLVLRPRWAALGVAALALGLPLINFARDTYTEPLCAMFIFSSLALLYVAIQRQKLRLWMLVGLAAGGAALLRVDMYTFVAALIGYLMIYLASTAPGSRRLRLQQVTTCLVPLVMLSFVAWVDVSQLSSGYYQDLQSQIMAEILLGACALVAGIALVALAWQTKVISRVLRWMREHHFDHWLVTAISIFFCWLALRALWLFVLAATGRANAMPVEAYASQTTLLWIAWYIGPVLGALGIIGFVWMLGRLVRGELLVWLPCYLVLATACALYLLNPQISADQVWAARRFLPIIFPGFILMGCWALERFVPRLATLIPGQWSRRVAVVIAALAVVFPALSSLPFWGQRSFAELPLVTAICRQLPAHAVVVWVGRERGFMVQPVQAYCGVPSLGNTLEGPALASALMQAAQAAAARRQVLYVAAAAQDSSLVPPKLAHMRQVAALQYSQPEQVYKRFPLRSYESTVSIVLARVVQ